VAAAAVNVIPAKPDAPPPAAVLLPGARPAPIIVNPVPGEAIAIVPLPRHGLDRKRVAPKGPKGGPKKKVKRLSQLHPSHYLKNPALFPTLIGQHLRAAGQSIYCDACKKPVTKRSTQLTNHVKGTKHKDYVKAIVKKRERDRVMQTYMNQYDKEQNTAGSSIDLATRSRRFEVAKEWLRCGLPFDLFDNAQFRATIEGAGPKLGGASTMRQFIQLVHAEEIDRLRKYLRSRLISVSAHVRSISSFSTGHLRRRLHFA
jgi:hypothetical protein